jgi:transcription-repair coupling factor (superfamily II helicase)
MADLYQLRGRVGRSAKRGFAFVARLQTKTADRKIAELIKAVSGNGRTARLRW